MSLEDITLPTNKTETKISNNRRKIRTGEKGLSIKVTVVDANDQPYNLTDFDLVFSEQKDQGKVVIDDGNDQESGLGGNFEKNDPVGGTFTYTLAKDVYGASGRCWFALKKGQEIIDTTKDFYFDVLRDATIHIDNDNYVSSLQAELDNFKANNQRIKDAADKELNNLKSQIQQSKDLTEKSKQDALNAIKQAKDTATTTLNNLNSQYSSYASKYAALESKINSDIKSINDRADNQINSIKSDWGKEKQAAESDRATIRQNGANEINSIKSDWGKQTDAINADAKAKIDAAVKSVETARDNAIKQAVTDFGKERDSLQSDYNTWKQGAVKDFNSQLATLQGKIDTETKQQSDLKASIDSARAAVDKITDVDFTKFAHKDDVDKALKSIDFGKIGIKANYLDLSTAKPNVHIIHPVKQTDGSWIIDLATNDETAENVSELLEEYEEADERISQVASEANSNEEAIINNSNKIDQLNNSKLNFINASEGYDLLSADHTWGIIEFNNIKNIKNLPPLSNKTWLYALKLLKDDFGSVIVFSQDNTIYQNVRNGTAWAGWRRVLHSDDLANLQNQINDRLSKSGGGMNLRSTINWTGGGINAKTGNLGGLYWSGGTDNAKIYADQNGNDNLDLAFDLGDDGSNHFSFRNKGSEVAAIRSDGHFTGTVDWSHVNGRPDAATKSDINNLNNKFNGHDSRIGNLERKINGLTPFTIITQAQYDKLTDAQKKSGAYGISG